jgi:hypothetical protein
MDERMRFVIRLQDGESMAFRVNTTGRLSPLGKVIEQIPQPVCVVFVKVR